MSDQRLGTLRMGIIGLVSGLAGGIAGTALPSDSLLLTVLVVVIVGLGVGYALFQFLRDPPIDRL